MLYYFNRLERINCNNNHTHLPINYRNDCILEIYKPIKPRPGEKSVWYEYVLKTDGSLYRQTPYTWSHTLNHTHTIHQHQVNFTSQSYHSHQFDSGSVSMNGLTEPQSISSQIGLMSQCVKWINSCVNWLSKN